LAYRVAYYIAILLYNKSVIVKSALKNSSLVSCAPFEMHRPPRGWRRYEPLIASAEILAPDSIAPH
jgi:hypothetical protein